MVCGFMKQGDRKGLALSAVFLVLIAFSAVFSSSVNAQNADVQALLDRINRLEADLNNVQRKVYQGQDVPAPDLSGNVRPITGGSEAAALLSTRLDSLEEEQRQVTGSLEEVHFKLDQMGSRLDKLILDIDFRLTEIEQRQTGTAVSGGIVAGQNQVSSVSPTDPALQNSVPAAPVAPDTAESAASASGSDLPKGTQLLGTLRVPADGGEATATTQAAPANTSSAVAVPSVTAEAPPQGNAVAAVPDTPVVRSPADQYNHAISLIRSDDYAAAEGAFAVFLENYSDHALAGNAQYWLGETFYVRGDYANAASAFLNGYQVYPDNSKAADNLLKLAMTLGRMDQKEEACVTFQQLDKQFTKLAGRLKRIENREKQKFGCK